MKNFLAIISLICIIGLVGKNELENSNIPEITLGCEVSHLQHDYIHNTTTIDCIMEDGSIQIFEMDGIHNGDYVVFSTTDVDNYSKYKITRLK